MNPTFVCLFAITFGWGRGFDSTSQEPIAAVVEHDVGFDEREVRFPGGEELELVGTLSVPRRIPESGAPAVLLLPGSGPTDRDGNQPPLLRTDLLKETAHRLAEDGFCVLRYDKRATPRYFHLLPEGAEAQSAFFSWDMFVTDARAAHAYLRVQDEVDAARAAIVGHSEGGLIALQIASDSAATQDAPAALVLAATPGQSLDEVLRGQLERNLEALPRQRREELLAAADRIMAQLKTSGTVPEDVPPALKSLFPPNAASLLQSYFTIEPQRLAESYPGPVLILQGEEDSQVLATTEPALLKSAFDSRSTGTADVVLIQGASHNFKAAQLPGQGIEGPVLPSMLDALSDWLTMKLER